jgi:hypothetical protein
MVAPASAATRESLAEALQESRRQGIVGFVVLVGVVLAMLAGMLVLAKWLEP